jgi:hypothetical protein
MTGQNRTTGAGGMIAQSVAEILASHVRLTVEGIDRMYLNAYVPWLQSAYGAVSFFLVIIAGNRWHPRR